MSSRDASTTADYFRKVGDGRLTMVGWDVELLCLTAGEELLGCKAQAGRVGNKEGGE